MNRFLRLAGLGLLTFAATLAPRAAHACGGGVGPDVDAPASVNAQRVFISAHKSGTTDVAVQLDVTASADFGILLPVPAEPVLDAEPIPTAEFDALDRATQVHFVDSGDSGSGSSSGIGCGSTADAAGGGESRDEGVSASSFIDIGPVSAVVLTADNSEALNGWLSEHAFKIPEQHQAMVDSYVGAGRYFIAFKRADAAPATRTSVGVHFTLPGDQRGYPLRMAGMGAINELAITVFVAMQTGAAPSAPFETLTLNQLPAVNGYEPDEIADSYRTAIRQAVAKRGEKAFVLEGVYDASAALTSDAPRLAALTDQGQVVSRLTTVVGAAKLDADVTFDAPAPKQVPTTRELGVEPDAAAQSHQQAALYLLLLPALLAGVRRSARQRAD